MKRIYLVLLVALLFSVGCTRNAGTNANEQRSDTDNTMSDSNRSSTSPGGGTSDAHNQLGATPNPEASSDETQLHGMGTDEEHVNTPTTEQTQNERDPARDTTASE